MANGTAGDHPVSDILDHGRSVYSPRVDELFRAIGRLVPRHRMWDLIDWHSVPALPELEELLSTKLEELETEARTRGWETDNRSANE